MTQELSPSQAAARIGTTTRTIQRWISLGRMPARRVGGRWRVASDALDAFRSASPGPSLPRGGAWSGGCVFVANRGEIARRIARSVRSTGGSALVPGESGIDPVDLLDGDAVVAAAVGAGADALHPGYGFLAENAGFADAVERAGIRWVGPPPAAIAAMGDKAAARRLAVSLGIPVVPGYDGDDQSGSALADAARTIGLPVLVKPAAGGGGKGMRVVRDIARFDAEVAGARREALAAFGDDRVILERYLEGPRHVEVQLLFDALGNGVHLGERDCSLQRRHQKVLEESPSPGLNDGTRRLVGHAALRLAGEVGYRSAGTCEFLLADDGSFYFLEMNTRLQVEHPVTELVLGRDLVADQLEIAAGASLDALGLDQATIDATLRSGGHAVEVRLYAEDAEAEFVPATGRVEALRWPAGATTFGPVGPSGVRIDAGLDAGTEIGARFDPMLAKVIAHGTDRAEALERLTRALDETLVLGVVTNLRFLRWLVRQAVVRDGQARIDTLDRIWPPDDWRERSLAPDDAWLTAARALADELERTHRDDVWAGGWRPNVGRLLVVEHDGERRRIVVPNASTVPRVEVAVSPSVAFVDVGGRSEEFRLAAPPDVDRAARVASAGGGNGGAASVTAPMPGAVVAVSVATGTTVEAGETLLTLEAMKMEHAVTAPIAGVVTDLLVKPGDQVARGLVVAVVEPRGVESS